MKAFFKKFSHTKLSIRLIYLFILVLSLVSYIFLVKNLLLLGSIETLLRVIVIVTLGIFLFLYSFGGLLLLMSKHHKSVVVISVIMMIISAGSIIASSAIGRVYNLLANINKEFITYTTNLIVMNSTEFRNEESFKVGIINNETDVEGNILPYELINNEHLIFSVEKYDTYFEMLEKLYNGELDGIFVSSNYVILYESYDQYKNIGEEVKVVKSYSKEMKNQDYIESTGTVTEPFTILLMGVDSTSDIMNANAAFNGDTLMVISFNPHTLNATVFSIPRDTYVPIACLNGESSKINSSAAYGSQCVINTVQNLIDIPIDYYVKIDFKGVVELVNALGGIDITVPDGIDFCEQNSKRSHKAVDIQCIKSGYQHMDGEKALAFSRHRHTLLTGDFQRVQHQQLVVEGMANSTKNLTSVNDFYAVLNAISNNIDTNMKTKEMLNLYGVLKNIVMGSNNGSMINIQRTYLTGYDLTMYVNNLRSNVYTFQYSEQSLEEIKNALKITLGKIKPEVVKTFNFSVNEEYKVPVIGQGYYTVQRNETIPNFYNKQIGYVNSWCEARGIKVGINYINDDKLPNGTVRNQSVAYGKLTTGVTSITVDVIKNSSTTTPTNNDVTTTTTTSTTATTTTTKEIVDTIPNSPTDEQQNNNENENTND